MKRHIPYTGAFGRGGEGARRTRYLGKTTRKAAGTVKGHVEEILNAALARSPLAAETARWPGEIPDRLRGKLVKVALAAPAGTGEVPTVEHYVASYLARRTDIEEATRLDIRNAGRVLVQCVGTEKRIDQFTKGDAADWMRWMKERHADATVARRMSRGSQFFADALDHELITRNPFRGVKVPGMSNKARAFAVDAATTRKLLVAAAGVDWRPVLALSRWAGLRIPSELLGLTWADVLWGDGKFLVHSPETEHHEDGASRWVPIFPELLPYLRDAWEAAPDGATRIICRALNCRSDLRSKLLWTIGRAGMKPWPRLFQNMRAPARRNSSRCTPCTRCARGSATPPSSPGSTTCKSPKPTSG